MKKQSSSSRKQSSSQPVAFITGASSGIGFATAECLLKQGYKVYANARRAERLKKLKGAVAVPFDVSSKKERERFFQSNLGKELLSEVTVLINNAGLARGVEKVQEAKAQDWDEMIDINIKGLIEITRLVLPSMIKRNQGHIVNMGSVAGRWVYPGGSVYCGTKHFVRAFSDSLRLDLQGTSLRVTNIEPGLVETEFSEVRLRNKQKAQAVYEGYQPLKPQDIAETIFWCLQRPGHVNIQELVIFPTAQAGVGYLTKS